MRVTSSLLVVVAVTLSFSWSQGIKEVSVVPFCRDRSFDSVLSLFCLCEIYISGKSFKDFSSFFFFLSLLSLTFTLVSCSFPLDCYCSMKMNWFLLIVAIGFSLYFRRCNFQYICTFAGFLLSCRLIIVTTSLFVQMFTSNHCSYVLDCTD